MKYFYFIAAAILILGGLAGMEEMPKLSTASLIAGLWCLASGIKERKENRRRELSLSEMETERAAFLQTNYNKALDDYNAVETARLTVKDPVMAARLGEMQKISGNLIRYMEKNPEKIPAAQKFIDYYQDRAAHLSAKYAELEETGLDTTEVNAMKARVQTAVDDLAAAYAEQFELILNDNLIDIDAELKVLKQTMDGDGVGKRRVLLSKPADTPINFFAKKNMPVQNFSVIPDHKRNDVLFTKVVQGALAIFLGGFGAHKFYQGKTWQGVLYILFCWTGIPSFIGFCEGIRYLCMKMDDFYLDYCQK